MPILANGEALTEHQPGTLRITAECRTLASRKNRFARSPVQHDTSTECIKSLHDWLESLSCETRTVQAG